ncbi:MAG: hypothetical protein HYR84_02465 [Planctomycetes bacterium]|nr:hypothetical protein [Planctomycetota bacterium]
MPIRFRCAYCNQLMGISRRKAGQVVRCPKCAGEIIVPVPEGMEASEPPPPPPAPPPAPAVFEDKDFDQAFKVPGAVEAPAVNMTPPPPPMPAPLTPPPAPARLGLFVPLGMLLLSLAIIVLLLILMFVFGLIIGRHTQIAEMRVQPIFV